MSIKLPKNLRKSGNKYYYLQKIEGKRNPKWIPLSRDLDEALSLYYARFDSSLNDVGIIDLMEMYKAKLADNNSQKPGRKKYSQATVKSYTQYADRVIDYFKSHKKGNPSITEFQKAHFVRFIDDPYHTKSKQRGKKVSSAAGIQMQLKVLKNAFDLAIDESLIVENPVQGLKVEVSCRESVYITDDELEKAISVATPQTRCLLIVAYHTALRRTDLQRLNNKKVAGSKAYVDRASNQIIIETSKTNIKKKIDIGNGELKEAIDTLMRMNSDTDFLFASPHSRNPLEPIALSRMAKHAFRKAGLDYRLHDLRSKCATDLLEYKDPYYVKEYLGHTDIATTLKYIRRSVFKTQSSSILEQRRRGF